MTQDATVDLIPRKLAADLYGDEARRTAALTAEPGLHNVLGFEASWAERPLDMDFLDPISRLHHLKQLSTRVYLDQFEPFLRNADPAGSALDAACGIGRFTLELARRFRKVEAVDPCRSSIRVCRRYIDEASLTHVAVQWADLTWLETQDADRFDVLFAIELICYLGDPLRALKTLVRAARPGALLCFSVEARPGALWAQDAGGPEGIRRALAGEPLWIADELYLTLFDRSSLLSLIERTRLEPLHVEFSHFFGEGPFWNSLDEQRLSDPAYMQEVLAAERACQKDPRYQELGRVLSAVCRVDKS